jgi:polyphosphate kinase
LTEIHEEIKNAKGGKDAFIILKLNNLVDPAIIKKLYQASQAGVTVKLIVRSMFSVKPAIKGMSENIEAISIVDKFLEHTRVYVFCNDGDEKYFISSADLMQRNLDHRVEATCPIYDKEIQQELKNFLEIQWKDNVKARILDQSLDNKFHDGKPKHEIRAQWKIYEYLKELNAKKK